MIGERRPAFVGSLPTKSILGSARVSRAGFGVSPKQSFPAKVRDRTDAIANTRDACATRKIYARHEAVA
ncbi:MAG: hypothetical protein DME43_08925 [Verrucomicrobia bacterium]|nr:MAG: hypothetical protein DME43_08925 [Verrucomicrobiota bacterium]